MREAGEKGKSLVKAPIFRLVSPLRERVRIALPAGISGRIELSLESEDEDQTYLEPTLAFEAALAEAMKKAAPVSVPSSSR